MNILLYTDPHWCQHSSIVRTTGARYSTRLENLVASINWVEELATKFNCGLEICLGDFFDRSDLNAEELTALGDIKWSNIKKYFLVGNHEMGTNDLSKSSTHLFKLIPDSHVIDTVSCGIIDGVEFCFLPYILESKRESLLSYFKKFNGKRVIISHNDIKGIQLGPWCTTNGFDIDEINTTCDLFLNGHIHNGQKINNKVYNLGNLTGLNFSEDGFIYKHGAYILDTATLDLTFIENPFAFYFYKIDDDIKTLESIDSLANNSILTWRTPLANISELKDKLTKAKNVICSRVLVIPGTTNTEQLSTDILTVDHLQRFRDFIMETLGTDDTTLSEIDEVVK